jgi:phage tail-like protein
MNHRKCNYRNFRFRLEIDGIPAAGFNEIYGHDMSSEPIVYRDNDDSILYRIPNNIAKNCTLCLRKGVVHLLDMLNWISDCTSGKISRISISLIAVDENGSDVATWYIKNALPKKYSTSNFQYAKHEVLFESLELVHEGMVRSK